MTRRIQKHYTNTKQQKPNTRPQWESHNRLKKNNETTKPGKQQVKQVANPTQSLFITFSIHVHRDVAPSNVQKNSIHAREETRCTSKVIGFMILWPNKSLENENPGNKKQFDEVNAKRRIQCYLATKMATKTPNRTA